MVRYMTEKEFNETIAQIEQERLARLPPLPQRRTGRHYRRQMKVRKNDRLWSIIRGRYMPHAGYMDWDFTGRTLLHSGKYIKYPEDSNAQQWMKRRASRMVRKCADVPKKGNFYRRLYDYWWMLY